MKKLLAVCCLALILSGCAAEKRLSGVDKTFLEDVDTSQKMGNLPFDHAWVKPDAKKKEYTRLYIKPIRLDKLPADAWTKSKSFAITSKADYDRSAKEIAVYFSKMIRMQLLAHKPPKYTLVNGPGPNTLVLEIALTELEFSHPIARGAALAAPVPGTGAALSAISDPHVAFAARINDGDSGELIATAADRKFPPTRIVDLNKLTVESSAREVCALWADTIAQALNGDGKNPITEERFSLLPW